LCGKQIAIMSFLTFKDNVDKSGKLGRKLEELRFDGHALVLSMAKSYMPMISLIVCSKI